ncbi:MAG: YggS family pyridoxal phosphate-dependent enzyme [Bacteroidales bacterium]|nr:YggS family pyridoxal phosphate-dependent enzyme [Bacteroidales bacterium]
MIKNNLTNLMQELPPTVKLVAVSKYHSEEEISEAYEAGQRIFAESRPQEFEKKVRNLPDDIQWHFIGHLQTNKLKMVLPYAGLIHSVDSLHLIQEIDKWGKENGRTVNILLEMHIASEETKQGFYEEEILDIMFDSRKFANVRICGLMGMATNTDDEETVETDFRRISSFFEYLRDLFPEMEEFKELSIGMSGDWRTAIRHNATMVRIGTAIFGERNYSK